MTEKLISKVDIETILGKDKDRFNIILKEETMSTNSDLKELALDGAENSTVVVALKQTAGRGRLGRSFYSPENSGIYLSYLLKPTIQSDDIVAITSATAVAVCMAIESAVDIKPDIKWVNDIYIKGKKVCGILAEAVRDNDNNLIGIVIGIGINCVRSFVPEDLSDIVGYLSDSANDIDHNLIVAQLIRNLSVLERGIVDKSFIAEYKIRSCVIGKMVKVITGTSYYALAIDVDDCGGLVVRLEDGSIKTLSTGEISIRLD